MSKISTRDNILNVAFMIVYAKGYNGTSTSMILKECNIPKGSLYHYFPSKKDLILSVLKERIAPKMDEFFNFKAIKNEHGIDTIINNIIKISENDMLIKNGCPLNRLNQEMSSIDNDFDKEITIIYEHIKEKIKLLLNNSKLTEKVDNNSLSDFIMTSVWGNISLSPTQSSKQRYLDSSNHLIKYLISLK